MLLYTIRAHVTLLCWQAPVQVPCRTLPSGHEVVQGRIHICREAKVEARVARRQDARAREESPDMVKLIGGGDVMGGDDSFAAAKARHARAALDHEPGWKFARAGVQSGVRIGKAG